MSAADELVGVWAAREGDYGERWEFRADGSGHAHFDGVRFGSYDFDFRWRATGPASLRLEVAGARTRDIDYDLASVHGVPVLRARGRDSFWPAGNPLARSR